MSAPASRLQRARALGDWKGGTDVTWGKQSYGSKVIEGRELPSLPFPHFSRKMKGKIMVCAETTCSIFPGNLAGKKTGPTEKHVGNQRSPCGKPTPRRGAPRADANHAKSTSLHHTDGHKSAIELSKMAQMDFYALCARFRSAACNLYVRNVQSQRGSALVGQEICVFFWKISWKING